MIKIHSKDLKQKLDNFLIINLYILIGGVLFLVISFIASSNGYGQPYKIFQRLWYPLFIPSFSLFFTAVLCEAIWNKIENMNNESKQSN